MSKTGDKKTTGGYLFGHLVFRYDGEDGFRYEEDGEPVDWGSPRPCPKCGLCVTEEGHDPCIANLPGVDFACCGHGVHESYIKFSDGRIIRGVFKVEKE